MANENKYNGWTNYETWLVALNIDNDRCLVDELKHFKELRDFKEFLEELCYDDELDIYLLSCDTLSSREWKKVNFEEIFNNLKADYEEDEE